MFPFWERVVAPVLEAAAVRRVVEIGALRGENTELMLERLGPDVELHVIDPVPDFDPSEHEARFAGRYVFHRDLSLRVLGDLPPMDAALVDGDHNWYTVYNELRLLREVARAADAPLPLLILHDVCWPYGRRDLYYEPENIPEEFRQRWRRTGMLPGRERLVPYGAGLNPTMCNAEIEGGPRNGVMTGLDDFMAEHDRPLRRVVLPIYFGLAIVAEEERLARQPELAAEFDRLESGAGKDELLDLAEETRLSALIFQHGIYFQRERSIGRIAGRYLDVVKRGLVDEHDADHDGTATPTPTYTYLPLGRELLDGLQGFLDTIRTEPVRGEVIDCGVGRGGAGIFLRAYLEAYDLDRQLFVVDSSDLTRIRDGFERFGLLDDRTHFLGSELEVMRPGATVDTFALVHLGPGLGDRVRTVLDCLYPRLAPGGFVVVDDLDEDHVRDAVQAFRRERDIAAPEQAVGKSGTSWRKMEDAARR
jgi:hypothetical protein